MPVLVQEKIGTRLYSLGPHGEGERTKVRECQGSGEVVL